MADLMDLLLEVKKVMLLVELWVVWLVVQWDEQLVGLKVVMLDYK
jgi:hypothetical protein